MYTFNGSFMKVHFVTAKFSNHSHISYFFLASNVCCLVLLEHNTKWSKAARKEHYVLLLVATQFHYLLMDLNRVSNPKPVVFVEPKHETFLEKIEPEPYSNKFSKSGTL